jgi:hypothetical protein
MSEAKFEDVPFESQEPTFEDVPYNEESDSQMSGAKAAGLGVIQGSIIGKHVLSGVEAVYDTVQDNDYSIQEFREKFEQEKDSWNDQIKEASVKHPGLFTAGQVTSGVATSLIPGMSGYGGAAALSAAGSYFQDEDNDMMDALLGGTLGVAGQGIGQAIGMAVKPVSDKVSGYFKGIASNKAGKQFLDISSKSKKAIREHLSKMYKAGVKTTYNGAIKTVTAKAESEAIKEFGEDLLNDGLIAVGDSVEKTLEKVSLKQLSLGDELGKFEAMSDSLIKPYQLTDTKFLYDDLLQKAKNEFLSETGGSTPAHIAAYKKVEETLREGLLSKTESALNLSLIHI